MTEQSNRLSIPNWVNRIASYQTFFVPVAVVFLIGVILVPLPPTIIDLLISANLTLAAVILLTTLYVQRPLDFSVFPSLLLGTTLMRLVLNIATTRLILTADADSPETAVVVAGRVIEAFSAFVAGDILVVGLILFIILVIVQFVVVTKGATRISEVAARFMLDAMPGKQMAIDADLNAGLVTEEQARYRRVEISQEADFYGAMDGASKFVRGDAIASIIITVINIAGGLAIGVFSKGWGLVDSLSIFTRLTIGDGLVSQIPAFVISIAAGLIVTRSSGRSDLGTDLMSQLTRYWKVLAITSGFLVLMAFTGLPPLPMLVLAAIIGTVGWIVFKNTRHSEIAAQEEDVKKTKPNADPVEQMLNIDTLELEVGYALVRLVDASQNGDLLERISMIRRQLAGEMGMVMPPVRIRDNMQLQPNDYHIKIRGNSVAQGVVYPDRFLAMDSGLASNGAGALTGVKTHEPAFGLEATWIDAGQKQRTESLNYTVVDPVSVLATHLTEVVRNHAFELLTREETNNLITQLRDKAPKLADEVLGAVGSSDMPLIKPGELQKVLQNLLRERVPVRDLETIVEALGDWAGRTKDIDVLTEYVRNALRRTICNQHVEMVSGDREEENTPVAPKLYCVSLDPALEDQVASFIDRSPEGTTMAMPPVVANRVTTAIIEELQRLIQAGHQPVVLASPQVRAQVRCLLEPHLPTAAVLGYNEISKGIEVESAGLVQLEQEQSSEQPTANELEGVVS